MAKVTEISYGYTANLGNYESERIDMTVQVDDTDDPILEMLRLRELVLSFAGKEELAHAMEKAANERARKKPNGKWNE